MCLDFSTICVLFLQLYTIKLNLINFSCRIKNNYIGSKINLQKKKKKTLAVSKNNYITIKLTFLVDFT